jgi:hypothetical protein
VLVGGESYRQLLDRARNKLDEIIRLIAADASRSSATPAQSASWPSTSWAPSTRPSSNRVDLQFKLRDYEIRIARGRVCEDNDRKRYPSPLAQRARAALAQSQITFLSSSLNFALGCSGMYELSGIQPSVISSHH